MPSLKQARLLRSFIVDDALPHIQSRAFEHDTASRRYAKRAFKIQWLFAPPLKDRSFTVVRNPFCLVSSTKQTQTLEYL